MKSQMIGKKFGRLLVLKETDERKDRRIVYKCLCDCGNITFVTGKNLRNGNTKSCGCLSVDKLKQRSTIHGKTNTKLFHVWCDVRRRCNNSNRGDYKYYGGRGIKVCDEWLHDFMAFYDWAMNNGYNDNLTIDRIDVNGNYEPNNCRWITHKEQCNNRRSNVLLTYKGKTQNMTQWAKELNISYSTIKHRHSKGWNDKDCLFGKGGKK